MVSRAALKCGNRLIAAYLHTKETLQNILEGFFPPRCKFFLAEFTELTDSMKLIQLAYLMNKDEQKSKKMAEFENLLNSLSVDLVR